MPAVAVADLLADPAIEIVLNLTIPGAHVAVGRQILAAGKHAYSEKPLGVAFAEAAELVAEAERRGLRLGSAPDTFLGGAHQQARAVLDAGALGDAGRRHRVLHVPGARALASESGLLLQARRRADARHGTLLHHRPGQPARAGGAGRRPGAAAAAGPHHHQRAAGRGDDRGRGADARQRQPGVRERRGGGRHHELRRAGAPAPAAGDLRDRGQPDRARPELVRRRGLGAGQGRRVAAGAGRAALDGRQLSLARAGRHGGGDPRRDGRTAPRGHWRCTCWR